jgi:hypothetical protein
MFFVSAFIFLISISKLNASDEFEDGSTLTRSRRAIPEGLTVVSEVPKYKETILLSAT